MLYITLCTFSLCVPMRDLICLSCVQIQLKSILSFVNVNSEPKTNNNGMRVHTVYYCDNKDISNKKIIPIQNTIR